MAEKLTKKLARRNLVTDRFGTIATILGVALGAATVNTVVVLDLNTRTAESSRWTTNPDLAVEEDRTVALRGVLASGEIAQQQSAKEETHEDYQVMRSAIRLGSLSAFLVGALIVFFTFGVVVERRKRELALLRSLGATSGQLARIFIREAVIIGVVGAVLGFLLSAPMSVIAAFSGITTTGRATLSWLWFPWKTMMIISALAGSCALLGIIRPALDVLRLNVPETLRPRFLDGEREARRRTSGITLITVPFMGLLYVLMRPFFQELLPSLAFFVLEAGLVCVGFLLTLIAVPEIVRKLGAWTVRLLPRGPAAPRLLTLRRVEQMGHEMAWSVSGVMLVFALLLALHLSTRALKNEVTEWARGAVRPHGYVYSRWGRYQVPPSVQNALPKDTVRVDFTGRTPWPNSVYAASSAQLRAFAETTGRAELIDTAARLGPGRVLISTMMSRRFNIGEGDFLEVSHRAKTRRLQVVAVSDDLGYVPMVGPYRNSKTYALIDLADFDLIEQHAGPPGTAIALAHPKGWTGASFDAQFADVPRARGVRVESGAAFERDRVAETDRDFAIFDIILVLTTLLAAVGIANNMVLSVHGRRREIALYRVLGMTQPQLRQIFVLEGAFIGLLGGALAVVLGVPLGLASIGALRVVSAFDVSFELPPLYAVYTIAGALLIAIISALYPATRAVSENSAESIHYE